MPIRDESSQRAKTAPKTAVQMVASIRQRGDGSWTWRVQVWDGQVASERRGLSTSRSAGYDRVLKSLEEFLGETIDPPEEIDRRQLALFPAIDTEGEGTMP